MGTSSSGNESVQALAALYAAERADNQNSLAQSLVLTSMLIAYSVGIGAVIATKPETLVDMPLLTLLLPLPVWSAVGFHIIINALVFAHNASIEVIEVKLRDAAGIASKPWVGAPAGRKVSDVMVLKGERRSLLLATVMSYGLLAVIVVGFTSVSVWWPISQGSCLYACVPGAIFYALLFAAAVRAWVLIVTKINETNLAAWPM
ncbi:hypothetical protein RN2511_035990 [Rhodococcus sp. NKCM2511]|uniref:hypothetical protein n=1 Tax=Rhodococcus sp. NKCM2511 TaxID=2766011 RepID=UPI00190FD25C|nr:hypothetical protein [Rhodococcus sp. NKCM2511]GHP18863.1 hypothetical protein RN2511_035990 [Rhodococcus sp. NKCM2511]